MKPRILFFLSVSMMLLVLTALFLYIMSNPEKFRYGPVLWAEKLSTKPERFMVLTDPDPYVVEALSNPGSLVFVGYWDNTNIDELIEKNQQRGVQPDLLHDYYGNFRPSLWIILLDSNLQLDRSRCQLRRYSAARA